MVESETKLVRVYVYDCHESSESVGILASTVKTTDVKTVMMIATVAVEAAAEEERLCWHSAFVHESANEIYQNYKRFESDGKYEINIVDYVIHGYLDVGFDGTYADGV